MGGTRDAEGAEARLTTNVFIEPLDSNRCALSRAGGKGANLSTLLRHGFPVPDGFIVMTSAYRTFVENAGLAERVVATAEAAVPDDPGALDAASRNIRDRFAAAPVPEEIATAVRAAYQELRQPAVAVRSSATAEDLPELSFAGQQETFLNIVSERALLDAVVRCWSSLWTARAIGYRSRNGVSHRDVALAVVVQRMVPSECSGVLFTANPISGRRTETVVEAALGLGEALVSGRVEPDRYIVAMPHPRIISRTLGSKRLSLRPQREGGITQRDEDAGTVQALADERILELARLGERAATLLRGPQDIEWAVAEGKLWLLQSRPITSIYPAPAGVPAEPTQVFFSIGAVQGMLEPFTPLGQDLLRIGLARAMARRFGVHIEPGALGPVVVAGERLFMNVTLLVRHTFLRERLAEGVALVEPGSRDVLSRLLQDTRLTPTTSDIPYSVLWRIARVAVRVPFNVWLNLMTPAVRRARLLARADAAVAELEAERRNVDTLAGAAALLDRALEVAPRVLMPYLASGIGAGVGMLRLLHWLARDVPDGGRIVLEATRGLPHNVTTEMDLALWRAARDGSDQAIDDFLACYGMRGVAEIDIGGPAGAKIRRRSRRRFEATVSCRPIRRPMPSLLAARRRQRPHSSGSMPTCGSDRAPGGASRLRDLPGGACARWRDCAKLQNSSSSG